MVNSVGCSVHIRREIIVRLGVRARPDFGRNKISKRATPRNSRTRRRPRRIKRRSSVSLGYLGSIAGLSSGLPERNCISPRERGRSTQGASITPCRSTAAPSSSANVLKVNLYVRVRGGRIATYKSGGPRRDWSRAGLCLARDIRVGEAQKAAQARRSQRQANKILSLSWAAFSFPSAMPGAAGIRPTPPNGG
jgi:hypothetical protein